MADGKLALNKGILDGTKTKDRIITDYEEIKKFAEHCKGLGIRIVLTQGTFDMVHIGHGRYLQTAKDHGDLLVVGVDNDAKVQKRKGDDRPIVPEDERLEMLTHLRPVDVAFLKKDTDAKWKLIKTIKPDVLIATDETYTKDQIKQLEKHCGEVKVLKRQATTTTSAKLRLLQMGVAHKLGQALTPKLINAIQESLSEMKGAAGAKKAEEAAAAAQGAAKSKSSKK